MHYRVKEKLNGPTVTPLEAATPSKKHPPPDSSSSWQKSQTSRRNHRSAVQQTVAIPFGICRVFSAGGRDALRPVTDRDCDLEG
uniref:Uncharacterized protein n=1 Tax=Steinernema glaseri TaxID=37863 RepID=A0A1I7ZZV4_9BILA